MGLYRELSFILEVLNNGVTMSEEKVSVPTEQLILSHTLQLTALVELLEEKSILTQQDVIKRMEEIRDRKTPI